MVFLLFCHVECKSEHSAFVILSESARAKSGKSNIDGGILDLFRKGFTFVENLTAMQANVSYQIKRTSTKVIITLDREMVDEERLADWLNFLKVEYLVKKAGFGEEIEAVGEELLAEWWEKNKTRFIPAHEL